MFCSIRQILFVVQKEFTLSLPSLPPDSRKGGWYLNANASQVLVLMDCEARLTTKRREVITLSLLSPSGHEASLLTVTRQAGI